MKKIFKTSFWSAFTALLIFQSCQKSITDENLLVNNPEEEITVKSAFDWFTQTISASRTTEVGSANTAFWDYAFEKNVLVNKKMVIIPVISNKKSSLPSFKQLWVYVDKNKKKNMRVVEYIYEDLLALDKKTSLRLNPAKFTGFMLVRNWDNTFISGFKLQNGLIVGVISEWNSLKNGRTATSISCSSITTCRAQTSYVIGFPDATYTQILECWNTTQCYLEQTFEIPYDGGSGTGFEIPGGGGTSTPMLHPYFTPILINNLCDLLTYQNTIAHTEVVGLKLDNGSMYMLPYKDNTPTTAVTENKYYDPLLGKPLLIIYQENGKTKIDVWNYDIYGQGTATTYGVLEHIHTHPCNGNENIASSYDKQFSSDRNATSTLGIDVQLFILNCNGKVEYGNSGEFKDGLGNIKITPTNCN
ncbi:MAG: hypothetical protein U0Y10_27255 [Spirosomataceae bacterium]